ncbi:Glyoxylase, beta-lactamase superfamily II [Cohnella sp. OV330]|uniref:MBL fold metallo-hydrolase n=1 Tax=Cohnella sp. OV330 TaxID=1855288 RepID=UPI0008E766FE|nr:MBL fold metallo-hydrolase [Cohnella sp. OV330]SFB39820.1 Glyoxylase, beta-lactamase superfamily II [Cohnella sp. OV330]
MRDSPPLWTRHANGIVQLRLPLPFALKQVNAYLLQADDGWTVVDPGLRTQEAEAAWETFMAQAGIEWRDIARIVATHYHPDHYGLAGWLQARTRAEVWLSETAGFYARRLWGGDETFSAELVAAFRAHGLPEPLCAGVLANLESVKRQVLPHPARTRTIRAGDMLSFGGARWEAIGGEGHAPGHLAFYDRERLIMLCGDQVLPDITPNIGWMAGGDPDPLGSYLSSLDRMAACEVVTANPGHREPFARYGTRVAELRDHHARRLVRMAALAAELAARDKGRFAAFAMCEALFGERIGGNPHNLRFAMAETIAHLERMTFEETLVRDRGSDAAAGASRIYYRAAR